MVRLDGSRLIFRTLIASTLLLVLASSAAQQGDPDTEKPGTDEEIGFALEELRQRAEAAKLGLAWPRMGDILGADGAPMVLVPAGTFLMGSSASDDQAHRTERPQRSVALRAFYIDKYEVTNAQYARFLEAIDKDGHRYCDPSEPEGRSHTPPTSDQVQRTERYHPVQMMGWYDAAAYCAWAGKRLPTDAEWEKAARGTDGRIYPWGSHPPGDRLLGNFRDEASYRWLSDPPFLKRYDNGYPLAATVGSFPEGASPYGAEDMAGNAQEWVSDRSERVSRRERASADSKDKVRLEWAIVRGGSWLSSPRDLRSASRRRGAVGERLPDVGFRCARDAEEPPVDLPTPRPSPEPAPQKKPVPDGARLAPVEIGSCPPWSPGPAFHAVSSAPCPFREGVSTGPLPGEPYTSNPRSLMPPERRRGTRLPEQEAFTHPVVGYERKSEISKLRSRGAK